MQPSPRQDNVWLVVSNGQAHYYISHDQAQVEQRTTSNTGSTASTHPFSSMGSARYNQYGQNTVVHTGHSPVYTHSSIPPRYYNTSINSSANLVQRQSTENYQNITAHPQRTEMNTDVQWPPNSNSVGLLQTQLQKRPEVRAGYLGNDPPPYGMQKNHSDPSGGINTSYFQPSACGPVRASFCQGTVSNGQSVASNALPPPYKTVQMDNGPGQNIRMTIRRGPNFQPSITESFNLPQCVQRPAKGQPSSEDNIIRSLLLNEFDKAEKLMHISGVAPADNSTPAKNSPPSNVNLFAPYACDPNSISTVLNHRANPSFVTSHQRPHVEANAAGVSIQQAATVNAASHTNPHLSQRQSHGSVLQSTNFQTHIIHPGHQESHPIHISPTQNAVPSVENYNGRVNQLQHGIHGHNVYAVNQAEMANKQTGNAPLMQYLKRPNLFFSKKEDVKLVNDSATIIQQPYQKSVPKPSSDSFSNVSVKPGYTEKQIAQKPPTGIELPTDDCHKGVEETEVIQKAVAIVPPIWQQQNCNGTQMADACLPNKMQNALQQTSGDKLETKSNQTCDGLNTTSKENYLVNPTVKNSPEIDQATKNISQEKLSVLQPFPLEKGDVCVDSNSLDQGGVPDPKEDPFNLSTVPCVRWTAKKLQQLIAAREKSEVPSNRQADIREIIQMYWNGDIKNIINALKENVWENYFTDWEVNTDGENPVILSHILPIHKEKVAQNCNILEPDAVYRESEYKSWLNLNQQLDDIDKEHGFPPRLTFASHKAAYQAKQKMAEVSSQNEPVAEALISEAPQILEKPQSQSERQTPTDPLSMIKIDVLSPEKAKKYFLSGSESQEFQDNELPAQGTDNRNKPIVDVYCCLFQMVNKLHGKDSMICPCQKNKILSPKKSENVMLTNSACDGEERTKSCMVSLVEKKSLGLPEPQRSPAQGNEEGHVESQAECSSKTLFVGQQIQESSKGTLMEILQQKCESLEKRICSSEQRDADGNFQMVTVEVSHSGIIEGSNQLCTDGQKTKTGELKDKGQAINSLNKLKFKQKFSREKKSFSKTKEIQQSELPKQKTEKKVKHQEDVYCCLFQLVKKMRGDENIICPCQEKDILNPEKSENVMLTNSTCIGEARTKSCMVSHVGKKSPAQGNEEGHVETQAECSSKTLSVGQHIEEASKGALMEIVQQECKSSEKRTCSSEQRDADVNYQMATVEVSHSGIIEGSNQHCTDENKTTEMGELKDKGQAINSLKKLDCFVQEYKQKFSREKMSGGECQTIQDNELPKQQTENEEKTQYDVYCCLFQLVKKMRGEENINCPCQEKDILNPENHEIVILTNSACDGEERTKSCMVSHVERKSPGLPEPQRSPAQGNKEGHVESLAECSSKTLSVGQHIEEASKGALMEIVQQECKSSEKRTCSSEQRDADVNYQMNTVEVSHSGIIEGSDQHCTDEKKTTGELKDKKQAINSLNKLNCFVNEFKKTFSREKMSVTETQVIQDGELHKRQTEKTVKPQEDIHCHIFQPINKMRMDENIISPCQEKNILFPKKSENVMLTKSACDGEERTKSCMVSHVERKSSGVPEPQRSPAQGNEEGHVESQAECSSKTLSVGQQIQEATKGTSMGIVQQKCQSSEKSTCSSEQRDADVNYQMDTVEVSNSGIIEGANQHCTDEKKTGELKDKGQNINSLSKLNCFVNEFKQKLLKEMPVSEKQEIKDSELPKRQTEKTVKPQEDIHCHVFQPINKMRMDENIISPCQEKDILNPENHENVMLTNSACDGEERTKSCMVSHVERKSPGLPEPQRSPAQGNKEGHVESLAECSSKTLSVGQHIEEASKGALMEIVQQKCESSEQRDADFKYQMVTVEVSHSGIIEGSDQYYIDGKKTETGQLKDKEQAVTSLNKLNCFVNEFTKKFSSEKMSVSESQEITDSELPKRQTEKTVKPQEDIHFHIFQPINKRRVDENIISPCQEKDILNPENHDNVMLTNSACDGEERTKSCMVSHVEKKSLGVPEPQRSPAQGNEEGHVESQAECSSKTLSVGQHIEEASKGTSMGIVQQKCQSSEKRTCSSEQRDADVNYQMATVEVSHSGIIEGSNQLCTDGKKTKTRELKDKEQAINSLNKLNCFVNEFKQKLLKEMPVSESQEIKDSELPKRQTEKKVKHQEDIHSHVFQPINKMRGDENIISPCQEKDILNPENYENAMLTNSACDGEERTKSCMVSHVERKSPGLREPQRSSAQGSKLGHVESQAKCSSKTLSVGQHIEEASKGTSMGIVQQKCQSSEKRTCSSEQRDAVVNYQMATVEVSHSGIIEGSNQHCTDEKRTNTGELKDKGQAISKLNCFVDEYKQTLLKEAKPMLPMNHNEKRDSDTSTHKDKALPTVSERTLADLYREYNFVKPDVPFPRFPPGFKVRKVSRFLTPRPVKSKRSTENTLGTKATESAPSQQPATVSLVLYGSSPRQQSGAADEEKLCKKTYHSRNLPLPPKTISCNVSKEITYPSKTPAKERVYANWASGFVPPKISQRHSPVNQIGDRNTRGKGEFDRKSISQKHFDSRSASKNGSTSASQNGFTIKSQRPEMKRNDLKLEKTVKVTSSMKTTQDAGAAAVVNKNSLLKKRKRESITEGSQECKKFRSSCAKADDRNQTKCATRSPSLISLWKNAGPLRKTSKDGQHSVMGKTNSLNNSTNIKVKRN